MGEFIKISAHALANPGVTPQEFSNATKEHCINVRDVLEIISIGNPVVGYAKDGNTKLRKAMVCLHYRLYDTHGGRSENHRVFYVEGTIDDWAKKLNDAIASAHALDAVAAHKAIKALTPPPPPEPPAHKLVDRGTWTKAETYMPLEFVRNTADTKTFICVKKNQTNSEIILTQDEFWCEIVLPALPSTDTS